MKDDKMAISESQKRANAKWDKENMITLDCKVWRSEADKFKNMPLTMEKLRTLCLKNMLWSVLSQRKNKEVLTDL